MYMIIGIKDRLSFHLYNLYILRLLKSQLASIKKFNILTEYPKVQR